MTRCASRRPPGAPCRDGATRCDQAAAWCSCPASSRALAEATARQPLCADIDGFSLHAAVRVAAHDRRRLKQLCRCITRPALSDERVQLNTRETGAPTIAVGLITEADQADLVALARGMLFDPRWPWHCRRARVAQVEAATQYWRSQPHGMNSLFGEVRIGMR